MKEVEVAIDNNVLAKLEARASERGLSVEEYIALFFDKRG